MNCWKRITVSINHKNLQALVTEMYKVSNNMFPTVLTDIFASGVIPFNPLNPVKSRKLYFIYKDTETLSHLGPKIWSLVPQEIKQSVSLGDFKSKIKNGLHVIVPGDYTENIYIR